MHVPLFSLHKYGSAYENNRLLGKPPLLGPPLSCAKYHIIVYIILCIIVGVNYVMCIFRYMTSS